MRVYVEADMTVCHGYHVVSLRAGQVVEGPLAVYLAESGCEVTIEHDDRDPAAEQPPATGESGTADPQADGTPGADGDQDPTEVPLSATVSQDSNAEFGTEAEPDSETGESD